MNRLLTRIVLSSKLRVLLLLIFYIQFSLISGSPFVYTAFGEEPWDAIKYREWPEGGSQKETGRELKADRNIRYGIDTNSHVDINVDENKLRDIIIGQYLSPEMSANVEKINSRLSLLKELSGKIKGLMIDLDKLYVIWDEIAKDPTIDAVNKRNNQISAFSSAMKKVFNVLENTIIERFVYQGKSAADAKKEMEAILIPMLNESGYDWNALMAQIQQEIKFLDDELKKVADNQPSIKIMAHILRSTEVGMGEPIYLPGHNTVEACRPTPVQKVTFNVPDSQRELFNKYSESVKNMNDAKTLGEALKQQLEVQGEALKESLINSVPSVTSAVSSAKESMSSVEFWGDENNRKQWIAKLNNTLRNSREGKDLSEKLNNLQTEITTIVTKINTDIELMNSFTKLKDNLATATPANALQTILATLKSAESLPDAISPKTWEDRLNTIKAAIDGLEDSLKKSPQLITEFEKVKLNKRNPIADFKSTSAAINNVILQVKNIKPEVSAWIGKALNRQTVLAVANLQPVPGQEIHKIGNKQLDTSFDLKTICGGRNEFDTIRVTYKYFQGEDELSAGWYNDFQVRKFGWQDTVVAAVAMTNQIGTDTYKPTASLNWIIDYTWWPTNAEKGVGSVNAIEWFSGGGITTIALDHDQTQDTELGLALTASFLNNKILVGYGADLQAKEDKGFWFFSINLFETPGMFNGSGTKSK